MTIDPAMRWIAFSEKVTVNGDSQASGEHLSCRVCVVADWLGGRGECMLDRRQMILRSHATGGVAILPVARMQEIRQRGAELSVRMDRRLAIVEFAGVAFDGWYVVRCDDQETAEMLAATIARLRGNGSGRWAGNRRLRAAVDRLVHGHVFEPWRSIPNKVNKLL